MLRKLLLSLLILLLICLLINPIVLNNSGDAFYTNPKLEKDQHFKLNQFISFKKNKQYRAYLILDAGDMKQLPPVFKKYRVLRTTDQKVIQTLFDLNFDVTGADMATVSNSLVVYEDGKKLFSSGVSLDLPNPGFQHQAFGWIKPKSPPKFIAVLSKFRPHYIPILILD